MRRAMLTMKGAGGPLTPVGGNTAANTTTIATAATWGGTAAVEAGTVTSVSARFATAGGTIRFFTIRDVSGTPTVRAATGNLTSVAGLSAYAVSLAIQPGDTLGVYQSGGTAGLRYAAGTGNYTRDGGATSPSAGTTYAVGASDASRDYAYVGTGIQ